MLAAVREMIHAQVAAHNCERALTAAVKAGLGLLLIVIVSFFMFVVFWFILVIGLHWSRPALTSLAVVGIYQLAAIISAWRRVDPLASITLSGDQIAARNATNQAIYIATGTPVLRREGLAAAAAILIGGPLSVLEAISEYRERIPRRSNTLDDAAHLLLGAKIGAPAADAPPQAAVLLQRLGLVKAIVGMDRQLQLVATQKGLDAITTSTRNTP